MKWWNNKCFKCKKSMWKKYENHGIWEESIFSLKFFSIARLFCVVDGGGGVVNEKRPSFVVRCCVACSRFFLLSNWIKGERASEIALYVEYGLLVGRRYERKMRAQMYVYVFSEWVFGVENVRQTYAMVTGNRLTTSVVNISLSFSSLWHLFLSSFFFVFSSFSALIKPRYLQTFFSRIIFGLLIIFWISKAVNNCAKKWIILFRI